MSMPKRVYGIIHMNIPLKSEKKIHSKFTVHFLSFSLLFVSEGIFAKRSNTKMRSADFKIS